MVNNYFQSIPPPPNYTYKCCQYFTKQFIITIINVMKIVPTEECMYMYTTLIQYLVSQPPVPGVSAAVWWQCSCLCHSQQRRPVAPSLWSKPPPPQLGGRTLEHEEIPIWTEYYALLKVKFLNVQMGPQGYSVYMYLHIISWYSQAWYIFPPPP